ncbi:hypothetical protein BDD12DRAFT_886793 [Trichophaea hybrida]|nr:hypothetical protein BDD12DRAFT_886793 [Trichophaea hybrida]
MSWPQAAEYNMITNKQTSRNGFEAVDPVFPLISGGLKAYLEGRRKIKNLAALKHSLNTVARDIELERASYELTCATLLDGLIPEERVAQFIHGNSWEDPKLHVALERKLGPTTRIFLDVTGELVVSLRAVMKELYLEGHEFGVVNKQRIGKQLKLALEKQDLLSKISIINRDLGSIIMGLLSWSTSFLKSPRSTLPAALSVYRSIRTNAADLHYVLKDHAAKQAN